MLTDLAIPALGCGQKDHLVPEPTGPMSQRDQGGSESFSTKLEQTRQSKESKKEPALDREHLEEPLGEQRAVSATHQLCYGQFVPLGLGPEPDTEVWEPTEDSTLSAIEGIGVEALTNEAYRLEAMVQVPPKVGAETMAEKGEAALPVDGHAQGRLEDVRSLPTEPAPGDLTPLPVLPEGGRGYRPEGNVQAAVGAPKVIASAGETFTGEAGFSADRVQNSVVEVMESGRLLELVKASHQTSQIGIVREATKGSDGRPVGRRPLASPGVRPRIEMAWQGKDSGETVASKSRVSARLLEPYHLGSTTGGIGEASPNLGEAIPAIGPSEQGVQPAIDESGVVTMEVQESELKLSWLNVTPQLKPMPSLESASFTQVAVENPPQSSPLERALFEVGTDLPPSGDIEEPQSVGDSGDAGFLTTPHGDRKLHVLDQYGRVPPQPLDGSVGEAKHFHPALDALAGASTPAKEGDRDWKPEPAVHQASMARVTPSRMSIPTIGATDGLDDERHDFPDSPSLDRVKPDALLSSDGWTEVEASMDIESEQPEEMRDTALDAQDSVQIEAAVHTRPDQSASLEGVEQHPILGSPVSVRQVVEQIVQKVELEMKGENGEIRLQLKPEHLGDLKIKIATDNGIVSATFLAESHTVKSLIEAGLPQLKQQLMQQGLNVQDVSVQVGGGSSHGSESYSGNPNPGPPMGWFGGSTGTTDNVGVAAGTGRYLWGNTIDYIA